MMPLSPSENKQNDGGDVKSVRREQKAPPPSLSKLRDEIPVRSSLVDRFQLAADSQSTVVPGLRDVSSVDAEPLLPMETPFKPQPSSRRTSVVHAVAPAIKEITPFKTPIHPQSASVDHQTAPPSSVRNVETLQAEIRRLHEQKLELIDKLAEADKRSTVVKSPSLKADPQLQVLQSQLLSKEDLVASLSREKEELIGQIAELQSEHFTETARLRMQIEELCSQQIQHTGRRPADDLYPIVDSAIETHNPRLSMLRASDEEKAALRQRLEDTQNQLDRVMSESKEIRSRLERELGAFKEQLHHSRNKELELEEGNELLKARLEELKLTQQHNAADEDLIWQLRRELDENTNELKSANEQVDTLRRQKLSDRVSNEAKIRELQAKVDQKELDIARLNVKIDGLSSQMSANSGRPSSTVIESINLRLEHTIQKMSQLQSAYLNLRKSYEELRDAKKREEAYFLSQIDNIRTSVSSVSSTGPSNVSDADYDRMLAENARLSSKLEQYKSHMEDLNRRLVDGMGTMDRLEDALATISSLENDLKSMSTSYEHKMADLNRLVDQLKTENKSLKSQAPQCVRTSSAFTADTTKTAANRDVIVDSLERDKRVMERQLAELCSLEFSGDYSDRSDSLTKRLRRLKSSFELLNATSALNDVYSLEKRFQSAEY